MGKIKDLMNDKKIAMIVAIVVVAFLLIFGALSLILGGKDEAKTKNDLKVNYKDGSEIVIKGVKDGWTITKEITIENKTDKEKTYNLVWSEANNTYKTQSDLLYSISSEGKGASRLGTSQIPVAASPILDSVKIDKDTKHTYKVKVWYKKQGKEKETDSQFNGELKVETK